MIFSVVLVILLSIGPICAMDSNIINDDSNLLSENNKVIFSSQNLEVSSYDSISETISHDDNVKNHSSVKDYGLLTSQYISDDIIQANDTKTTTLVLKWTNHYKHPIFNLPLILVSIIDNFTSIKCFIYNLI